MLVHIIDLFLSFHFVVVLFVSLVFATIRETLSFFLSSFICNVWNLCRYVRLKLLPQKNHLEGTYSLGVLDGKSSTNFVYILAQLIEFDVLLSCLWFVDCPPCFSSSKESGKYKIVDGIH